VPANRNEAPFWQRELCHENEPGCQGPRISERRKDVCLKTYLQGKNQNIAYGRTVLQRLLVDRDIHLSAQQLRLRLEKLNKIGLLIIRPGRGGTTISEHGEQFLRTTLDSFNQGKLNRELL